jgi:hypothetical protein
MPKGVLFWVIFIICLLFTGWSFYSSWQYASIGGGLVTFILIGLLGWQVYGPPIQ